MKFKKCKQCKNDLPKTKDYFHINNGRKDGFNSVCKKCLSRKNDDNFDIKIWYKNKSDKFKNRWKYNDIKWLYDNYLKLEKKDILNHFNNDISYKTLTNLVYQWDLRKINKKDNWSEEDIRFLISNYPSLPQKELENHFPNRTWDAIKNKASKLNIHRNEKVLFEIRSESHRGFIFSKETRKKLSLIRRGERNHNWKGGISPIVVRLREYTIPWKFDSLKAYGFKCALSFINDGTLEIHHLNKNFSEIVYETFNTLNLPIYNNMSKYSQKERDLIRDKLLELHYRYGLGIPLTKEIHKLFHSIYGNKNNTPEQFDEFKQNYINSSLKNVVI